MPFKGVTGRAAKNHSRQFRDFLYVYPVISRRSGGLSIGVNLNPDKKCNFACAYCQVNREPSAVKRSGVVNLAVVERELIGLISEILGPVASAKREPQAEILGRFPLNFFKDIALSGDGEPTTFARFARLVDRIWKVRNEICPPSVRIVLITNGSGLHRPQVVSSLGRIDEVWAKLDAGTEKYYQRVCQGSVPFRRVLVNLAATARLKPLVIQSMFIRLNGRPPTAKEIQAYANRLAEIQAQGGEIARVQIYTLARPPAESRVSALSNQELQEIAGRVRSRLAVKVAIYGS